MKINYVKVKNFRNFNEFSIKLNPDLTFIIGENNLGKSNILDLLDVVFNKKGFDENDFKDVSKEIEVELTLELDNIEIGLFDDLTSPGQSSNKINLVVKQTGPDENLEIIHKESGEKINQKKNKISESN